MAADVIVVGGGIVGLAIADGVRRSGLSVTVFDGEEAGAWSVAAGMLAPVSEAQAGDEPHLELGLESARRWPAFAEALGVGLRAQGTVIVARDRDDAEALERLARFRTGLGIGVTRLRPSAARRLEPALAPTIRLALDVPGDRAVDPRAVVAALRRRVAVNRLPVAGLAVSDGAVTGVRHPDGTETTTSAVVVAAGAWSGAFGAPVRPVKGQVLRLRDRRGPGLLDRCVRTLGAYIVPRDDGVYVLGASMDERGWDRAASAGATFELLRDMSEVVPGILELDLEETLVGFRPGTPDNAPILGPDPHRAGLHWATGHWRNGVLLTPATVDAVLAGLRGEPLPAWAAVASAGRFGAPGDPERAVARAAVEGRA